MKVKVYKLLTSVTDEPVLLAEFNVRNVYESSFYFRPVPTIGARRCRQIINATYPQSKPESMRLLFEDVESGYRWTQELHRDGTILTM